MEHYIQRFQTNDHTTADAACTSDDVSKISSCVAKISLDVTKATDKAYLCTYAQSNFACYPSCACADTTYKASMDSIKSTYSTYLSGCDLTCKTSGGIRIQVSAWTVAFTMLVAIFGFH